MFTETRRRNDQGARILQRHFQKFLCRGRCGEVDHDITVIKESDHRVGQQNGLGYRRGKLIEDMQSTQLQSLGLLHIFDQMSPHAAGGAQDTDAGHH